MAMGTTPDLFGYPDMGRTGLGHSLLAWARCAVWCRDAGATMLAPRWARLRIGPYLRRERDKRNYFLLFHKGAYVGDPARLRHLLTAKKFFAELDLPDPGYRPNRATVVVFRNALGGNDRKFFHHIADEGPFLRQQFLTMVRPRYIPPAAPAPFIAAHVRMGDFGVSTEAQLKAGATNSRIPVEWYAESAVRLREGLGEEMPIVVFSDGPDESLQPLLSLPKTTRAPRRQSVTDMLSIAQAQALVASGSGFSLWGSFFGSVPRVCYPGQGMKRRVDFPLPEVETDGEGALPAEFLAAIRRQSSLLTP